MTCTSLLSMAYVVGRETCSLGRGHHRPRSHWRRFSVVLLVRSEPLPQAVGLRGHVGHPERPMETAEHQKGPADQAQLDQLWVGEMASHLRHKRRVEGR